jgi:hypothetical protein
VFDLGPAERAQQRAFRAFAAREIAPHADGADADERLPRAVIRALAEAGHLGAALAREHGGGGMSHLAWGLLHAEIGRACASARSLLTVQTMVGRAIERWGSEAQRARYLPRLARGEMLAAFALSEPGAGSDLSAIEASARLDGDDYVIEGDKRWISFGQVADLFLVFARLDGALAAFLVEPATEGFERAPIAGLLGCRASQLADLALRACRLPREARLGGGKLPFSLVATSALDLGRYSVAWGCVGLAEACVLHSVEHTRARRQGGKALADHQLVQRLLTRMITDARAARLLCAQAGTRWDSGDARSLADTMVAKYFASTAASRVSADAVQLHGAVGCARGAAVERHFRDAKVMEIIEGSTQIQETSIAALASAALLDEER